MSTISWSYSAGPALGSALPGADAAIFEAVEVVKAAVCLSDEVLEDWRAAKRVDVVLQAVLSGARCHEFRVVVRRRFLATIDIV